MDLISSSYGWSDDQILDLTLPRMRQIVAAIQQREYVDQLAHRGTISWQTRTLAQIISLTVPFGKGDKNPLLDLADQIDLLGFADRAEEVEQRNLPSYEQMLAFGQAMERGPSPR